jgi:inosine-uridine nucleoside N-ribohydrolase
MATSAAKGKLVIPVILDTDIGTDIDDTWALAMLLRCPELDLRLVTTATGDTEYRARIVAGLLAAGGRSDVPIGIGIPTELPKSVPAQMRRAQLAYAEGIDLKAHEGSVLEDGVDALVRCVMTASERVTILTIGPLTNIASALAVEPSIATRARIVGMLGAVRNHGPFGDEPRPEYNVRVDIAACRSVIAADWEVTITPLDTCGWITLEGDRYAAIRDSDDPLLSEVIENYRTWSGSKGYRGFDHTSTALFDTAAVYLGYDESFLEIERLPISVEEDGRTTVAESGADLRVATGWKDRDAFTDHLLERLTGRG